VVRRLLPDGSATDVLGELVSLDEEGLQVQPDDGPLSQVPTTDVVAAKVVPARTVRPSSSAEAVQRVADLGWPGLERRRLGGWTLRAAGGFTGRANSALAVGDPGLSTDEALEEVRRFYAERDLPARLQVPFPVGGDDDPAPGLDSALADRGWVCDPPTLLMTADLRVARASRDAPDAPGLPDLPEGLHIDVSHEPDPAWLSLYRYRGGGLPPVAAQVLTAAPWQRFLSLQATATGATVAVGRVAVAAGWAGVTAMQVDDAHRRRGLGAAALGALLDLGVQQGARFGYLQVLPHRAR
jgi:GNAT superfamily N-acetyltransferase